MHSKILQGERKGLSFENKYPVGICPHGEYPNAHHSDL
jgi:hypothetical protein